MVEATDPPKDAAVEKIQAAHEVKAAKIRKADLPEWDESTHGPLDPEKKDQYRVVEAE